MVTAISASVLVIAWYGLCATLWIITDGIRNFDVFICSKLVLMAAISWSTLSLIDYVGTQIATIFF